MTETQRERLDALLQLIDRPGGSMIRLELNAFILSDIERITCEILKKHCL